jgi:hypothetical protein
MASGAWKLALTILTCISLSLPPTAAEAGMRTGTWRNWNPGWGHHGGWAYRHGAYPGHYGSWGHSRSFAYRYGGWRYGGYGYRGYYPASYGYGYDPGYYYYRRRRSNAGAALAAGLIGGIALGAILANSSARADPRCPIVHRRIVSPSGRASIRHVRAC